MFYPSLVEGLCYDPITFANKLALEREQAIAERDAAAAEATRLREKKREMQAATLKVRNEKCTSYGFTPSTNEHATCVMELAIAADANEQQRISNAARAAAIASQAAAANAASEAAADEARRQRQAQALIGLGSAISSGGTSSSASSSSPIAPLSSGRYETCRYRVGGEIVSSTVGRAELCPARRSIGGRTGYLVR